MGKFEMLDNPVEEGNGYLRTAAALENGISKRTLEKYVAVRHMERAALGVI